MERVTPQPRPAGDNPGVPPAALPVLPTSEPVQPGQLVQPGQSAELVQLNQPAELVQLDQHVQPAESARGQLAQRPSRLIALAFVVGAAVGLAATVVALTRWYGTAHPLDVALVGGLAAAIVTAHALSTVWARSAQPPRREVLITQAPYPAIYVFALVWGIAQPFPAGYVGWVAAFVVALSWLTVGYLRVAHKPRRGIVYLVAAGVLVAGNGGAVAFVGWQQTDGYGLVGQRTPWDAMDALIATSCLVGGDKYYQSGAHTVRADCPTDVISGGYDEDAFASQLCADQPRAAFQVWWEFTRRYQLPVWLDFAPSHEWQVTVDGKPAPAPRPTAISGDSATITMRVSAFQPEGVSANPKYQLHRDKDSEMWNVTARHSAVGGWKVCAIDIPNPIQASAVPA